MSLRNVMPEYRTWKAIRRRCRNRLQSNYAYYGGRGIDMAPEFDDFAVFFKHVGLKPSPDYSIDRIDNARGYEPGNVRWATKSEQMKNRRPFLRGKGWRLLDIDAILGGA